jgi:thiol:disulfide interchange protein DsbD
MLDEMNNWVAAQLSQSSGASAYFFLLLGGLLASLLPCVYPVYPLTVNFLRNRKSSFGRFAHPLAYFLGLVLIYFVFGVIASLTGGAFNEILRYPISNLLIGLLLFLLALATVDYLHLPFFGGEVESKNQGLFGTLFMGAGAGLLSSACVGPIVVSILVGIASGAVDVSIGMVLSASSKMALFGMGLGVPVLLLGVFGVSLPKSGKWMLYVQWIFAILIGYFSFGYLVKALNGWGFEDQIAGYLILAAILTGIGITQIQTKEILLQERIKKALYGLGGIMGILVMTSLVLSKSLPDNYANPSGLAESSTSLIENHGNLTWHLNKSNAYEQAGQTGKYVFIDFYGDWCTNCKVFEEKTISDQELNGALQNAVLYKVYDTSPEFETYKADPRFPELKIGLPFFLITDASGNVLYKTNDLTQTEEMILFLE